MWYRYVASFLYSELISTKMSYFCSVVSDLLLLVARVLLVQQTCYQVHGTCDNLKISIVCSLFRQSDFILMTQTYFTHLVCATISEIARLRGWMDVIITHHWSLLPFKIIIVLHCGIEGFLFQLICAGTFFLLPFIVSTCTYAFFKYL